MGVDIETYRGRIGCFKGSIGCDVVTVLCNVNFSSGMKIIGAVVFIGLLLIIGGIEPNPGPPKHDGTVKNTLKEIIQNITEDPNILWIAVAIAVLLFLLLFRIDVQLLIMLCLLCLVSILFLKRTGPSGQDQLMKGMSDPNKSATKTPRYADSTVNQGIVDKPSGGDDLEQTDMEKLTPNKASPIAGLHEELLRERARLQHLIKERRKSAETRRLRKEIEGLRRQLDDVDVADVRKTSVPDIGPRGSNNMPDLRAAEFAHQKVDVKMPTEIKDFPAGMHDHDEGSTHPSHNVGATVNKGSDTDTAGIHHPNEWSFIATGNTDPTVNQGSELKTSEEDGSEEAGPSDDSFLNVLLQRLGMSDKYPEKITSNEVVCVDINSPSEDQAFSVIDAPYILLKKIISVDCKARDTVPNGFQNYDSQQRKDSLDDTDDFFNDFDLYERNSSSLSPLDIFHIVLACCDPMLKQKLYRNLYICKMALPFITKFNTLRASRLEIWPLRTLSLFDSDTGREENVLNIKSHFLGFARLGRPAFSKSRLLNSMLSGEINAFPTFYNNECTSGMIEHTATHGLVESFWLQTNIKTSVSSKTVAFFNLRGELNDHFDEKSRMFIQATCQCLVLIPDLSEIEKRLTDMAEYLFKFKDIIFVFPDKPGEHVRELFKQLKKKASKRGTDIFVVNTKGGTNFFDIVCSLAERLKSILAQQNADTLEYKLKSISYLRSDEDEELNRKGKLLASEVLTNIRRDVQENAGRPQTSKPYKCCVTPVSAMESKKIAKCMKEIEKEKSREGRNILLVEKHSIQENSLKIVTPSLKCFLRNLKEASNSNF